MREEYEYEEGALIFNLDKTDPIQHFSTCQTEVDLFQRGSFVSHNGPCHGVRDGDKYVWKSYEQVWDAVRWLSDGLVQLGVVPGQTTRVGTYMRTSSEYAITILACHVQSMVVVPLYDTLGHEAMADIIEETNLETVVCDTWKQATWLALSFTRSIKRIVVVADGRLDETTPLPDETVTSLRSYSDVLAKGMVTADGGTCASDQRLKNIDDHFLLPKPNDVASILYTSGTTGKPKGVIRTHFSNTSVSVAFMTHSKKYVFDFKARRKYLCYLPLAHVAGQQFLLCGYYCGGALGFFNGDAKQLFEDVRILRPHVMPSVPVILNKLYKTILNKMSVKPATRTIFNATTKLPEFLCKIIYRKARLLVGGNVQAMLVGAAPTIPVVVSFLRSCFGCVIIEMYGMTEVGIATATHFNKCDGTIGIPLPCVMLKLVNDQEQNVLGPGAVGELRVKGPAVASGYFGGSTESQQLFDSNGWLRTGDLAVMTSNRKIQIVGRNKSIFKLAQGEYIAPEKIESIYSAISVVSQVFVYGDCRKAELVGIVVPDLEVLVKLSARYRNGELEGADFDDLCGEQTVVNAVLSKMLKEGTSKGLKSFEQVKEITLVQNPLTIDNGILTPTLKIKRFIAFERFKLQIENMYQRLENQSTTASIKLE